MSRNCRESAHDAWGGDKVKCVHQYRALCPAPNALTTAAPTVCSDYLFINLLIAPYYPPGEAGGTGHRRRLLAAAESQLVGEALSVRSAGPDPAHSAHPPQLVAAKAEEDLERRVRKLLARPKLTLAQRQPARRQHRRLLTEGPTEEPANVGGAELPELKARHCWGVCVLGSACQACLCA